MNFSFIVNVSVDRTEGKFATKDEIREQILDALNGADPQSYDGDNGGQYETTEWDVSENE